MTDYSSIERARALPRVELLRFTVQPFSTAEGQQEGVDFTLGKHYVGGVLIVMGIGLAAGVLERMGVGADTQLLVQTAMVGAMVGQLAKSAVVNGRIEQTETAYIQEHGTAHERDEAERTQRSARYIRSLKRPFLVLSAVLTGSMVAIEWANGGHSTLASTVVSLGGGLAMCSALVLHAADKNTGLRRSELADALAKRRGEAVEVATSPKPHL